MASTTRISMRVKPLSVFSFQVPVVRKLAASGIGVSWLGIILQRIRQDRACDERLLIKTCRIGLYQIIAYRMYAR